MWERTEWEWAEWEWAEPADEGRLREMRDDGMAAVLSSDCWAVLCRASLCRADSCPTRSRANCHTSEAGGGGWPAVSVSSNIGGLSASTVKIGMTLGLVGLADL